MKLLLALFLALAVAQPAQPKLEQRTFRTPDGTTARYGLAVPADYTAASPRPLVVALHPGGGAGRPFYGDLFMRSIFLPGLRDLRPIIIAPDVPARAWTEPQAEQVVLSLMDAVSKEFAIDSRRVLVAGFSLGGTGAWFFSARHPTRFTAAIVMAGRTEEALDALARIPTYVIHSRDDEVVPFAPAEERATALQRMQRPVVFEALSGLSHYEMDSYVEALQRGARWVRDRWDR